MKDKRVIILLISHSMTPHFHFQVQKINFAGCNETEKKKIRQSANDKNDEKRKSAGHTCSDFILTDLVMSQRSTHIRKVGLAVISQTFMGEN